MQEEKGTTEDEMAGSPSNHHQVVVDGISNSMDTSLSKLLKLVMDRKAWRAAVNRVTKCRT